MYGRIVVFMASALLSAPTLSAQVPLSLSSEVGLHSAYEGRGLTFTDAPVLQGSVDAGSRFRSVDIFVGVWANFEVFESIEGRRMLPAGVSGPSEINLYAGLARSLGPARLELGTIRFLFPRGFDFSEPDPLTEVYGRLAADVWGEPAVTAYYDLSARGWYGDLEVSRRYPFRPGELALRAQLGASLGQADAGEYYGADGLTHAALSAAFAWQLGSLTVSPSVQWTYAVDDAALLPGPTPRHGARNKGIVGLSVSWEL